MATKVMDMAKYDTWIECLIENIKDYCGRVVASAHIIMNDIHLGMHERTAELINDEVRKLEKYAKKLAADWELLKNLMKKQKKELKVIK